MVSSTLTIRDSISIGQGVFDFAFRVYFRALDCGNRPESVVEFAERLVNLTASGVSNDLAGIHLCVVKIVIRIRVIDLKKIDAPLLSQSVKRLPHEIKYRNRTRP